MLHLFPNIMKPIFNINNKYINFISICLFANISLNAQNAKQIFDNCMLKCKEIKSGSIEYNAFSCVIPSSYGNTFNCHIFYDFVKTPNDSFFINKFKYYDVEKKVKDWYDGKERIMFGAGSTVHIRKNDFRYPNEPKYHKGGKFVGLLFYHPIINTSISEFEDTNKISFTYLKNEKILDKECYLIKISIPMDSSGIEGLGLTGESIRFYWIGKEDYIPYKIVNYSSNFHNGTEYSRSFSSLDLISIKINVKFEDDYFSTNSIPKYYKRKD